MSTHLRLYELEEEISTTESTIAGFRAYLAELRPHLEEHYLVVPVSPWDGEERQAVGRGLRAILK